jgi:hypothetical protein
MHSEEQLGRRKALGPLWRDPLDELNRPIALVCDRGDGLPMYPDSFTSAFKRLPAERGCIPLPGCTTCATPSRPSSGGEESTR